MVQQQRIGIIGCGFSGLLTLHHLVKESRQPLIIRVYDQRGEFGKGLAYSTSEPRHLLNVPVGRMGALPDKQDHFFQWICRNECTWRSLHPSFARIVPDRESFLPRMVYGAYLKHILERTLRLARRYGHRVELLALAVHHIDDELTICDTAGEAWKADRVVLASGYPGVRQSLFHNLNDNSSALREPWSTSAHDSFWQWFDQQHWQAHSHIVLLGTGLSAVDMLHSLRSRSFHGRVTAVSRHGLLPKPHKIRIKGLPEPDLLAFPRTALGLFQKIDRDIDRLNLEGRDWRIAIDQLRPVLNSVWDRLPLAEQRNFLRDYLSWWSVLRHRMPPESYALIEALFTSGKFRLRSGRLLHVDRSGKQTQLYVQAISGDTPACLAADAVIDTRGFTYNLSDSDNRLLLSLRQQDMIGFSPLETGVPTDGNHRVLGRASGRLYALGPLLFGERLETSAVPELRQQAQSLAKLILKDLSISTGEALAPMEPWPTVRQRMPCARPRATASCTDRRSA